MKGSSNAVASTPQKYQLVATVVQSNGGTSDIVGRTCTAVQGSVSLTATTNNAGVAIFNLDYAGTWVVSCDAPATGNISAPVSVLIDGTISYASFTITYTKTYSMSINSTTFQTDPTGCLTYTGDCTGFTPVSNTRGSLGSATTVGSWGFNLGTGKGPLGIFYATLNSDMSISKILNPNDLTKDINGSSSDIATKNTMLIIPTLYIKRQSNKLTLSDDPTQGTPYAHTIGGRVYKYLGIGVYSAYTNGSTLMSLSGVLPTKSQTRAVFRTQANANGTNWMLWNYHHWMLMRDLGVFFPCKSFDGQGKVGRGGYAYGSNTTGICNSMGPWAGDVSGNSSACKALIENWWGSQYEFIDDFYGTGGTYYVGQNAIPTDYSGNKVTAFNNLTSGWWYGNTINTSDINFGIASSSGGSVTTCLCDGQYGSTSSSLLGYVGGDSDNASGGYAGPSYLYAGSGLSLSGGRIGARLACVFD